MAPDSVDHQPQRPDKSSADDLPPAPLRRRDRDSGERRDERDFDRPPARHRAANYYDRDMSPPPRERDRDYKRRRNTPSPPPPPYRDRRHSPPHLRRSPPSAPFKRFRRDDRGFSRRGSPRGLDDRREGLMSYKQFIQELEDNILPAEAERRYQEYRSEYISTQKHAFFDAHKDEEWLRDKYHPTNLLAVIERRNEHARRAAQEFLLDLQSGMLDLGPSVTVLSSNKSGQASDPNSDDEADAGGKRRRHVRSSVKENEISAAPKAHPVSSEPRRIQADIEQAQALAHKLDSEKGIEDNILCSADNKKMDSDKSAGPIIIIRGLTSVKGLEGIELLDTLITYLWRIHGLDYYGMVETNEAKGFRHVRVDGRNYDETSKAGADWEKKLESFWQERLSDQDPLERMTAKEKIDAAAVEVLDPHVRKIKDEKYGWKYGCGAKGCTKLFHATEYVHKHLKLKHPDLVMELTSKVREDLYLQNYMNDPDAPGGTPVMQQPPSKDKLQRHKPSLDNHLRNFRGNQREQDRIDRVIDGENSPPKSGGPESGNLDKPLYDTFSGQGLGAVPPEMPTPPVLMPVPGAGPLGPFVPAPPEVAMQILRDKGGPSAFEGGGRNMWSGPQIGGPMPILAVSPALRQDPRRIRSYQDLDAPEDEVTVIDYRSL